MVLIVDTKKERQDGGYTRLFDNPALGGLISKVHATSIRTGKELESLVIEKHSDIMSPAEFEAFAEGSLSTGKGRYIICGKVLKNQLNPHLGTTGEPDFIVVLLIDKNCYIIELKDGDTFDTKKSDGELLSLTTYRDKFILKFPDYSVSIKFCSFNASTKEQIVAGLKGRITSKEAMTGREFCELIGISFENILQRRRQEAQLNLDYFVERLVAIPEICEAIQLKLDKIKSTCPDTSGIIAPPSPVRY